MFYGIGVNWSKIGISIAILLFGWLIYRSVVSVGNFLDNIEKDRQDLSVIKANNDKLKKENDEKQTQIDYLSSSLEKSAIELTTLQANWLNQQANNIERQVKYEEEIEELKKMYGDDFCATQPIPSDVIRMHKQQWQEARARNKSR